LTQPVHFALFELTSNSL